MTRLSLSEAARKLKAWYHRGEPHGLTVEEVDAVLDAACAPSAVQTQRDKAFRILRAMYHEYMKDEMCDPVKINTLIESGGVLVGKLTESPSAGECEADPAVMAGQLASSSIGAGKPLTDVLKEERAVGYREGYEACLARSSTRVESVQQFVLDAIEAEPALPGHMPDEMWAAINGDRDAIEEAMRIAVRQTKSGIKERLNAHVIPSANGGASDDDKRFEWLASYVFDRKWDGTIGRPSYWQMAGPYRHELMKMRGNTLREAIDAAMQHVPSSTQASSAKGGKSGE